MVKVAISAMNEDMDSVICPTFGRCPGFLVVELEGSNVKSKTFVPNPAAGTFRGAGISSAQLLASQGCSAILTGNVGPNAWGVLGSSGIKIYQAVGLKIKDALDRFSKGGLQEIAQAGAAGFGGGQGMGAGGGMGRGAGRRARWQ